MHRMNAAWPLVALRDVLVHTPRPVIPAFESDYREIGIRSHGRGIFHKPAVSGHDLGTKRVFAIAPGDFVLNIIFAWEGAVAVVSDEETDMIASHRFPTFRADRERLDARFLLLFFRTPNGLALLGKVSPGGAGRNRTLNRRAFLDLSIPLPSLAEQRRIVARTEGLFAEVRRAIASRQNAATDSERIMEAAERRLWPTDSRNSSIPLHGVTTFLARGRQSEQGESDHFLIKTQHVQQGRYVPTMLRLAPHIAAKVDREAIARSGDILIACSAAGCLGRVARYLDDGRVASSDTHIAIARPNPIVVDGDYLYAYLRGAQGQHQLRSRERGDWQREKVGFRLTELNLSDLRQGPFPEPPSSVQRRIVAELETLKVEVDGLKRLQAETATELDALLPAVLDRAFKGEL